MTRPRPDKYERLSFTVYGPDVGAVQRVASLLPGLTPHGAALRALRLGLPMLERELRDEVREAARALDGQLDCEGL